MIGVLVVNARVFFGEPLCDDCFIPAEDITPPEDIDPELLDDWEDRPIWTMETDWSQTG